MANPSQGGLYRGNDNKKAKLGKAEKVFAARQKDLKKDARHAAETAGKNA